MSSHSASALCHPMRLLHIWDGELTASARASPFPHRLTENLWRFLKQYRSMSAFAVILPFVHSAYYKPPPLPAVPFLLCKKMRILGERLHTRHTFIFLASSSLFYVGTRIAKLAHYGSIMLENNSCYPCIDKHLPIFYNGIVQILHKRRGRNCQIGRLGQMSTDSLKTILISVRIASSEHSYANFLPVFISAK